MSANDRITVPDGAFIIRRVFDAPRSHVWKAWSEAKEMQSWRAPKGCSIKVAMFEFRPGGFFHYSTWFPDIL